MDISNNIREESQINKLTLECLMNPIHYDKYVINGGRNKPLIIPEEQKFYKKRVLALTKEMYKGNYPNNDIKIIFETYLDNIINYFKFIDTKDILQEEYAEDEIKGLDSSKIDDYNEYNEYNINESVMNIPVKTITMDNFITRKKDKPQVILPINKEINLKNPSLKRKGLKKKKAKKKI